MSKGGLKKRNWIIIFLAGAAALWATIEYLFWGKKPSSLDEVWFAILIVYVGIRGRIDEQDERLQETESRIQEIESRIEELESQSQDARRRGDYGL